MDLPGGVSWESGVAGGSYFNLLSLLTAGSSLGFAEVCWWMSMNFALGIFGVCCLPVVEGVADFLGLWGKLGPLTLTAGF